MSTHITPMAGWPIGSRYCMILSVQHKNKLGIPDHDITERTVLESEAQRYIAGVRTNPHASAWVMRTNIWRGMRHES